ncbi:MAG TPA: hypothetical protein VG650_02840 [Mycobacteriales bacterium]|nr:hypothetical protein [Mycobacteriales bacterium]
MNAIDERAIREQLQRAVAPLDPAAPPLEELRARAARRRRLRYSLGATVAVAAAAIVAVVLVVVPGGGSSRIQVSQAPSEESLASYAAAHHGKHVAGPLETGSGYVGAYATKNAVVIARYVDGAWQADGSVARPHGAGQYILRLSGGESVIPGHASFAERDKGGDVTYFGGVFYDDNGTWRDARFARCANRELSCAYPGTGQPYGHVVGGKFVSIHNDCTPYCAAGTEYRVTWRWDAASQRFVVATQRVIKR